MERVSLWRLRSCRLHTVLLLSFSYFCSSLIIVNFGLNLSCMVEDSGGNRTINSRCERSNDSSHHSYGGTLSWSRHQQDILLSATSWGSLVAQIPSIWVARRLSNCRLLLSVMASHAILNAFIPLFAEQFGFDFVFLLRVLIGVAHSFLDVVIYSLIDKWFPRFERSTALAIFAVGGQVAGIVGGPITGHICASSIGWQANYYLTSGFGVIFCLLWFFLAAESPKSCGRISKNELAYLTENVHVKEKSEDPVPYRHILSSIPVWSEFQLQFASCIAQNISQSYMPQFFKEAVMISVVMNGYFTAIPNLCSFVVRLGWSTGIDILKRRQIVKPTTAVKLSQGISSLGVVVFFLVLAFFVGCSSPLLALVVTSLLSSSQSLESAGHITSLLSLAPQHTETLSAMSMFFAQCGRLATPYIVGALRKDDVNGWEHVFLMAAGMNLVGGTIFILGGSGVEQPWATPKEEKTSTRL